MSTFYWQHLAQAAPSFALEQFESLGDPADFTNELRYLISGLATVDLSMVRELLADLSFEVEDHSSSEIFAAIYDQDRDLGMAYLDKRTKDMTGQQRESMLHAAAVCLGHTNLSAAKELLKGLSVDWAKSPSAISALDSTIHMNSTRFDQSEVFEWMEKKGSEEDKGSVRQVETMIKHLARSNRDSVMEWISEEGVGENTSMFQRAATLSLFEMEGLTGLQDHLSKHQINTEARQQIILDSMRNNFFALDKHELDGLRALIDTTEGQLRFDDRAESLARAKAQSISIMKMDSVDGSPNSDTTFLSANFISESQRLRSQVLMGDAIRLASIDLEKAFETYRKTPLISSYKTWIMDHIDRATNPDTPRILIGRYLSSDE